MPGGHSGDDTSPPEDEMAVMTVPDAHPHPPVAANEIPASGAAVITLPTLPAPPPAIAQGGMPAAEVPAEPTPPRLNAGQSLVAAFRAARLRQRPTLRAELRDDRAALRETRLQNRRRLKPAAAALPALVQTALPALPAPREEQAQGAASGRSVFARFIGTAQEAASPLPAAEPADAVPHASTPDAAPACAAQEGPLPESAAPESVAPESVVPESVVPESVVPESARPDSTPSACAADIAPLPVSCATIQAPPLSTIGFGPGMVIRLRQLGIESAADLAEADAATLRDALGDIARLINVDIWIASARQACAQAAPDVK